MIKQALKPLWERWKRFGKKIGDWQARFLLIVFYFTVLPPFALLVRLNDPLSIGRRSSTGWRPMADAQRSSVDHARRQF